MRTEASISLRGLLAIARLLIPWEIGSANVLRRLELFGELIIAVILETMVLALGIFILITLACIGLM